MSVVAIASLICFVSTIGFIYEATKKDAPSTNTSVDTKKAEITLKKALHPSFSEKAAQHIETLERENQELRAQVTSLSEELASRAIATQQAKERSPHPLPRLATIQNSQPQSLPSTKAVPLAVKQNTKAVQPVFTEGESALIETYNHDVLKLRIFATTLGQTRSSLETYFRGVSDAVQLEVNSNGKYWAILSDQTQNKMLTYYLMLRKDIQLNQQNLSAVEACYKFSNKSCGGELEIVYPAVATLAVGQQQIWQLKSRGHARFKDGQEMDSY